jgi:hypothetical protein
MNRFMAPEHAACKKIPMSIIFAMPGGYLKSERIF